ncbi:hypothetical protein Athai_29120 [Actinocatenispora thailandica]|uniref:Exlusion protein FxsA n=1 Tax=Actinocatenispora thailandica TaxID=227318 RepID=A0A7R7DPA6_9ACTN|nr:FxsA family protein [Actinocatenispora thailandica]BCJ35409.1 hypothetical protein Athai_29120 [Actinocatenispora thailandica]
MRLAAIALVTPVLLALAELAVLLAVAHFIGLGWALLILLATSVAGAVLIGRVGPRAWRRFRGALNEGRPPGAEATNGLLALAAAALIAFPGYLSDVVGALLLIPALRRLAARGVQAAAVRRLSPDLAGQVFGPRTVRVRQHRHEAADAEAPLEGDIVEPR